MRVPKSTILCALAASGSLLVLFTTCPAQQRHLGSAEANPRIADLGSDELNDFKYDPDILQVARIIGVESDIENLHSLTSAREAGTAASPSLDELLLRQQITEAVVAASLDIDSVAAEINYERDQTVELRSLLRYKRDRAIGSTNLAVLAAGSGLGIVSGLLQFSNTTSSAGNIIGFAGGGLSTLFSLRSYRQVHGGKRPAWVLPNMLAAFLGQQEEEHSHYPAHIWAYLNSVPSGASSSKREQLLAARAAHSVVLLAFGSDSLVELLSATVVLLAFFPRMRISPERASRWAAVLLFVLTGVVALTSVMALVRGVRAETSGLGMAITAAALIVMPVLAWAKRKLARATGNRALATDAVQSATCAWLAVGTLAGLAANALFHLRWVDSVSALAVLPILVIEGRRAMRNESCGCC